MPTAHRLSDGTTLAIRTDRGIAGTTFTEVPSRKRPAGTLMRIDRRMYLVLRKQLVPITHPDYEYAADDKQGAAKALAFFTDSAESCIQHAAEQGIDVADCYGPVAA